MNMMDSPKFQIIQFIVMVIVGMAFNPMNALAYRTSDLYVSQTLFYGGLLMASNMIWSHEIVHLLTMRHLDIPRFFIGIGLSCICVYLLRSQFYVNDIQWLKRMISHHSTALTTSHRVAETSENPQIVSLANDIIRVQEQEITLMKQLAN